MMAPTFNECWFDVPAQETVAELIRSVADIDGIVVEIGAWEGRSTLVIANAAWPKIVHTCDTWAGAESDESGRIATERDVKKIWQSNVQSDTRGNVVAHHMDWRHYVATIDEPVSLCFIDAEHTYDEVFDNIVAILPHVVTGGIICGDDIECEEVHRAAVHALGGVEQRGRLWAWVKP